MSGSSKFARGGGRGANRMGPPPLGRGMVPLRRGQPPGKDKGRSDDSAMKARGLAMKSNNSTGASSVGGNAQKEDFQLVSCREQGAVPLYAMAIRLTPGMLETLKREEELGGTTSMKFSVNKDGHTIKLGGEEFRFSSAVEPGDCDIYEEQRRGEDGKGVLLETGAVWRKLSVIRTLSAKDKANVKARSVEAERLQKSRKAIILDHNNSLMNNKANTAGDYPAANGRRAPVVAKPKKEPPPAAKRRKIIATAPVIPPLSAVKTRPMPTPAEKPPVPVPSKVGKTSVSTPPDGAPMATRPPSQGAAVPPVKPKVAAAEEVAASNKSISVTQKDKVSSPAIASGGEPSTAVKTAGVVSISELRSLLVTLLTDNPKGMSVKAVEKAVGEAMPLVRPDKKQIEKVIKAIASYHAPGKYLLKEGIEKGTFAKPSPGSGSSPDIAPVDSPALGSLPPLLENPPEMQQETASAFGSGEDKSVASHQDTKRTDAGSRNSSLPVRGGESAVSRAIRKAGEMVRDKSRTAVESAGHKGEDHNLKESTARQEMADADHVSIGGRDESPLTSSPGNENQVQLNGTEVETIQQDDQNLASPPLVEVDKKKENSDGSESSSSGSGESDSGSESGSESASGSGSGSDTDSDGSSGSHRSRGSRGSPVNSGSPGSPGNSVNPMHPVNPVNPNIGSPRDDEDEDEDEDDDDEENEIEIEAEKEKQKGHETEDEDVDIISDDEDKADIDVVMSETPKQKPKSKEARTSPERQDSRVQKQVLRGKKRRRKGSDSAHDSEEDGETGDGGESGEISKFLGQEAAEKGSKGSNSEDETDGVSSDDDTASPAESGEHNDNVVDLNLDLHPDFMEEGEDGLDNLHTVKPRRSGSESDHSIEEHETRAETSGVRGARAKVIGDQKEDNLDRKMEGMENVLSPASKGSIGTKAGQTPHNTERDSKTEVSSMAPILKGSDAENLVPGGVALRSDNTQTSLLGTPVLKDGLDQRGQPHRGPVKGKGMEAKKKELSKNVKTGETQAKGWKAQRGPQRFRAPSRAAKFVEAAVKVSEEGEISMKASDGFFKPSGERGLIGKGPETREISTADQVVRPSQDEDILGRADVHRRTNREAGILAKPGNLLGKAGKDSKQVKKAVEKLDGFKRGDLPDRAGTDSESGAKVIKENDIQRRFSRDGESWRRSPRLESGSRVNSDNEALSARLQKSDMDQSEAAKKKFTRMTFELELGELRDLVAGEERAEDPGRHDPLKLRESADLPFRQNKVHISPEERGRTTAKLGDGKKRSPADLKKQQLFKPSGERGLIGKGPETKEISSADQDGDALERADVHRRTNREAGILGKPSKISDLNRDKDSSLLGKWGRDSKQLKKGVEKVDGLKRGDLPDRAGTGSDSGAKVSKDNDVQKKTSRDGESWRKSPRMESGSRVNSDNEGPSARLKDHQKSDMDQSEVAKNKLARMNSDVEAGELRDLVAERAKDPARHETSKLRESSDLQSRQYKGHTSPEKEKGKNTGKLGDIKKRSPADLKKQQLAKELPKADVPVSLRETVRPALVGQKLGPGHEEKVELGSSRILEAPKAFGDHNEKHIESRNGKRLADDGGNHDLGRPQKRTAFEVSQAASRGEPDATFHNAERVDTTSKSTVDVERGTLADGGNQPAANNSKVIGDNGRVLGPKSKGQEVVVTVDKLGSVQDGKQKSTAGLLGPGSKRGIQSNGKKRSTEAGDVQSREFFAPYEKRAAELKGPILHHDQYLEYCKEYHEKYPVYVRLNTVLESDKEDFDGFQREIAQAEAAEDKTQLGIIYGKVERDYIRCSKRFKRMRRTCYILHDELADLKQRCKEYAEKVASR